MLGTATVSNRVSNRVRRRQQSRAISLQVELGALAEPRRVRTQRSHLPAIALWHTSRKVDHSGIKPSTFTIHYYFDCHV